MVKTGVAMAGSVIASAAVLVLANPGLPVAVASTVIVAVIALLGLIVWAVSSQERTNRLVALIEAWRGGSE
jgi:hypothetical protein